MNSFLKRIEVSKKIAVGILSIVARPFVACHRGGEASQPDSPQLTPKLTMRDVTFYSKALQRNRQGFWEPNKRFASLLKEREFQYVFLTTSGDHNWKQWEKWLPKLFQSLGGTSPLRR